MSHLGLAIDPQTNDLFIDSSHNLATVQDAHAVGQHARQRLMTFRGEWFLDVDAGVPWIGQLLGQRYNPALSEAVVKAEILDTDGVTEITSFSVAFDLEPRRLRITDVDVRTEYDQEVGL